MDVWETFHCESPSPRKVTPGRLEIEQDGEVAYLDYSLDGDVLELTRTEVPKKLRSLGLASSLAESALRWAREHNVKVDIICPFVQGYVAKHPEHSDLVLR
jgi:uncharacterized protein